MRYLTLRALWARIEKAEHAEQRGVRHEPWLRRREGANPDVQRVNIGRHSADVKLKVCFRTTRARYATPLPTSAFHTCHIL